MITKLIKLYTVYIVLPFMIIYMVGTLLLMDQYKVQLEDLRMQQAFTHAYTQKVLIDLYREEHKEFQDSVTKDIAYLETRVDFIFNNRNYNSMSALERLSGALYRTRLKLQDQVEAGS